MFGVTDMDCVDRVFGIIENDPAICKYDMQAQDYPNVHTHTHVATCYAYILYPDCHPIGDCLFDVASIS